ncbi:MAG: type III pantothenate kinase, partial [Oscillospiraceae bacterium]
MVLTVDVGNTNIVLGGFKNDDLVFVSRVQTNRNKMSDEYAIELDAILRFYKCYNDSFETLKIQTSKVIDLEVFLC